ncbi:MAG TPA: hypothetical protein VLT33_08485 [Labilithrix sp.]|nr:hypothetical protein [Labilithrix sp.]
MTGEVDRGPIDSRTWPQQLDGHAVSVSDHRLFGYDVERDLAAFYRFSDVLFLSLVGELPDDARSRAFEIALCFTMPVSVAHAAVHAAALARLCGARPSGVLSAGGLVLGEEATAAVSAANDALAAQETSGADLPPGLRASSDAERASVARLAALLDGVLEVPALRAGPSRDVALLAVFRSCGVTSAFSLACLVALARLPSAVAEASRVRPGDFPTYPLDTPHFEYVAPPHAKRESP